MTRRPPRSTLFPYPPLFRSVLRSSVGVICSRLIARPPALSPITIPIQGVAVSSDSAVPSASSGNRSVTTAEATTTLRSEEHTSELQSRQYLVCRLLLEKKTN